MKKLAVWWVLISCLLTGSAFAQQWKAGDFGSYVLSLSWEPVFCESPAGQKAKECRALTPDQYGGKNLTLHGLWPNKDGDTAHAYGYCGVSAKIKKLDTSKTRCSMPEPDLSAETKDKLAIYMPGIESCLERHEWFKHGTCSKLSANDYFTKAYIFVEQVPATSFGKLLSSNIGKTVTAADLLAQFEADFGEGTGKAVSFFCSTSGTVAKLSEVQITLSKALPENGRLKDAIIIPKEPVSGSCPSSFLIEQVGSADDSGLAKSGVSTASIAHPKSNKAAPAPLLQKGQPVDWWFVFKFNGSVFPGCGSGATQSCIFGGQAQTDKKPAGQQYVYASSASPSLKQGAGCVGDTLKDPVGATFDEIYNGSLYYVIWNDQLYGDPVIPGCTSSNHSCASPWGHSKGILAWNDAGDGVVMQVTTPSWPASGSAQFPRADGNTLGCISDDNNIAVSQHFFSLRLSRDDVKTVLNGLYNASVGTDPSNKQLVKNGGPAEIQAIVKTLGKKIPAGSLQNTTLSTKVGLISKPSALHVPPWQMVSATLNGMPLRTATWWAYPKIDTTTKDTAIGCWGATLGTPGPVQIATTGQWQGTAFGLKGVVYNGNHAKLGVSTDPAQPYVIFGDLNQQGALSGNCGSSQNGRGGTFYVIKSKQLFESMTELLKGDSAP
jgi:ribonuclease I